MRLINIRVLALSFLLLVLGGCHQEPAEKQRLVLFDFESDAGLDGPKWECHQSLELSAEFVTHGDSSLKIELYPSNTSPGLKIDDNFDSDWSGYAAFHFDVFNPQSDSLCLYIMIDDQNYHDEFVDRFQSRVMLPPGGSHHIFPFDRLVASRTGRRLNLNSIDKVSFLTSRLEDKTSLYFDYLHLE